MYQMKKKLMFSASFLIMMLFAFSVSAQSIDPNHNRDLNVVGGTAADQQAYDQQVKQLQKQEKIWMSLVDENGERRVVETNKYAYTQSTGLQTEVDFPAAADLTADQLSVFKTKALDPENATEPDGISLMIYMRDSGLLNAQELQQVNTLLAEWGL